MIATNFELAPPPVRVDGLWAVPVDIQAIDATLYFDAKAQRAEANVYVEFIHGERAGCPVFDLRQQIGEAWFDGTPVAPSKMAHHDFGTGPDAAMRILEVRCKPRTAHTLRLRYTLGHPAAPAVGGRLPALQWIPDAGVRCWFGFSDLGPGRYLDSWLPANLIYDQYTVDIGVTVSGTREPHTLIENGNWATQVALNRWWVEYRRYSTALSPMFELHPSRMLRRTSGTVKLPVSRKTVTIDVWKEAGNRTQTGRLVRKIAAWLGEHEKTMGRYVHGDRFVAMLQSRGGMEYDGGCTSSVDALYHEVFHSWWARALKPASQNDGWIDEAWTMYCDGLADTARPFNWSAAPVTLSPGHPWWRLTPREAYSSGPRFFQGMAHLLGSPAKLHRLMRAFYKANAPRFVTTAALEKHFAAAHPLAEAAFARFVHGRAIAPESADAGAGTRTSRRHGSGADRRRTRS